VNVVYRQQDMQRFPPHRFGRLNNSRCSSPASLPLLAAYNTIVPTMTWPGDFATLLPRTPFWTPRTLPHTYHHHHTCHVARGTSPSPADVCLPTPLRGLRISTTAPAHYNISAFSPARHSYYTFLLLPYYLPGLAFLWWVNIGWVGWDTGRHARLGHFLRADFPPGL